MRLLNRRFVVLAGLEANELLARESEELLRSKGWWGQFARTVNASEFLISIDGPAHTRLRNIMKPGFSRNAVADRLPEFVSLTREIASREAASDRVPVVRLMQRLVTQQLGVLVCNYRTDDYFEDLRIFINTVLNVTVVGRWPRIMLYRPSYRRARRRVYELARAVIAHHQTTQRAQPDIIDDLLAAHGRGEIYETEDELLIGAVGPFLAGMDTVANTLAFMLYALLRNASALERIRQEAALLLDGEPTVATLKRCPALHGAVRETLRLYPVGPAVLRTAARTFDFKGYRVDEGELVMIAVTIPHQSPDVFHDPDTFDVDRFADERPGRRCPGTFTAFGLGPHACLGSSLGELMMALTVATLVHDYHIETSPKDYELRVAVDPIPTPAAFRVRLVPR
jgi:cytochrome P450